MRASDARRATRRPDTRPRRARADALSLALLGPPAVERAGRAITFDTRKALALLAYLAVTGQRQARERLAALFWPDADAERARGALRRTLSTLRTSRAGDWLLVDGVSVGLKREGLDLDVERFRALRARGGLIEAVSLWRGEFLSGLVLRDSPEFEEWQSAQADGLRDELSDALGSLVSSERHAGKLASALAHARRWLELDRLNEAAHREVMRLHALAGDRSGAIRQYHECVQLLDRELGVAPLEETVALYDSIREGRVPREERPIPPAAGVRNVDEAVGDLYTLHGSYAKAVASYESALGTAPAEAQPAIEHKLAEVHHRRGEWELAEAHYRKAAESASDVERAHALADWSLAAHRRGDPERAMQLARKALVLARRANDERALAQAHNILGILARDPGHLEKALALAEGLDDGRIAVAALNNLALARLRDGDAGRALPLAERALAASETLGDRHREAALHNNMADVLRKVGRGAEAMRHLKRAATLFSEVGGAREPEVWKLVEW